MPRLHPILRGFLHTHSTFFFHTQFTHFLRLMDTFAASAFLEPGLTRRSNYIKVFLLFFIFANSSSFFAKSSLPVFLVFFLTKMAHKIFIILIQDFFSSSYADRNNGAVPQFEVIFGILYIVHIYQITFMAI